MNWSTITCHNELEIRQLLLQLMLLLLVVYGISNV